MIMCSNWENPSWETTPVYNTRHKSLKPRYTKSLQFFEILAIMTYSCPRNFVAKSFLNVLNILTQMSLSPSPMLTQPYFVRAVRRLWYSKQHWGKKNDTSVSRNLTRVDDSKKLPLCSEDKLCHQDCGQDFTGSQPFDVLVFSSLPKINLY